MSLAKPGVAALGSILAIAMTGATIPAAAVGVLADFLVRDLGLTNTQIGLLLTAFSGASALWSGPGGRLSDWAGGRIMLVACFSTAALGMVVLAAAPSFTWMVLAVVVGGLANGVASPATNKLVSSGLPAGSRGTVVGVKQSGVQVAYLVAGLMLPTMALASHWRWAFAATALIPLLGLLMLGAVVAAEPISVHPIHEELDGDRIRAGTRWLIAYALLMGAAIGPVTAYLPLFAIQNVGLGVQAAGALIGVLSLVAIVARVLLGRHGENSGHYARLLATLALVSFIGVCFVWVSEAMGSAVLWWGSILLGASLFSWTSIGMLAVIRDAGHEHTGRASGWMMAAFLGGTAASPALFGYSVDATGSYRMGWAGVLTLLMLATVAALAWLRSSGGAGRAERGPRSGRAMNRSP